MQKRKSPRQLLKTYREKRDFKKTPEPSGDAPLPKHSTKEFFFCVQKHLASHLHYDFRLEHNGVLLSWAVPKGPSLRPSDKRLAMRVEDHPFDYGEFEGVIPEGYGAGIVMLWDKGTWQPQSEDIDAALRKGELKFQLNGVKLKGSWVIVRTGGNESESRSWLLIKHRDEWAGDIDITTFAPRSVKSDGDFEDILARKKPDFWQSHRPAKGGEAGAMFEKIIAKVAALKNAEPAKSAEASSRSGKAAATNRKHSRTTSAELPQTDAANKRSRMRAK
jgi:bifunctional non-homologous end joining protein LigD